ncbi:winged helix-turn-helix transcriptional regulator [Granulicella cerasi]|uniref:Winged helix-turn-helix transcriptional regulator n=1 Tax=Granulicella cerasi TaxID=741063 RepID=A0ABW1Z9F3_9BACT|nr:helix-turn-helix domain-containing protein [Granulicella cerasi]
MASVTSFPTRPKNSERTAAYVRRAQLMSDILLQGKWRIQILCALREGPVRIGQLGRMIPGASKKVLSQNLRSLEADGIVTRTDMSDLILHVEYALNEDVRELVCDVLDLLSETGAKYLDAQKQGYSPRLR